jgi:hypothetical protein
LKEASFELPKEGKVGSNTWSSLFNTKKRFSFWFVCLAQITQMAASTGSNGYELGTKV